MLSDAVISKNYLSEKELKRLNNLVDGFLTLAESRAQNEILRAMKDWKSILDSYIELNQLPILVGKGKISSSKAHEIAKKEYEKFKVIQDKNFQTDFDKWVGEIKHLKTLN